MSRRHGVLDSSDNDGGERQYDERNEDAFDGILNQTESLLRVHCTCTICEPNKHHETKENSRMNCRSSVVVFKVNKAMFRK